MKSGWTSSSALVTSEGLIGQMRALPDEPLDVSGVVVDRGRRVLKVEADALLQLSATLGSEFSDAVHLILSARQRVIVSGIGKSGHIGRKIAATLASTGTPALFLHPAEAAHGDLGMIVPGDLLLIFSNSGSTPELQTVARHVKGLGCKIIGVASQAGSPLMKCSDVRLLLPTVPEACPSNVAPTTSTTLMLALGDALAVAVMEERGFTRDNLRLLHPGGSIGSRLVLVDEIMHPRDQLPLVEIDCPMQEVVIEMTRMSLGIAGVVDGQGRLIGVITDGDLRRNIDQLFSSTAAQVMTADPKTIDEGAFCEDALAMMQANLITALFVMARDGSGRPAGLLHIHDFSRRS